MSHKFINRRQELALLKKETAKKQTTLIVIRGRRRIGKSALVQEFAKTADVFLEFQGLPPDGKSTLSQLDNFAELFADQTNNPLMKFRNWTEAFSTLDKEIQKNKKTIILLDEISWMAQDNDDLPGKLKIAWDTKFKKHSNLTIFICGSVSGWIEENILNNAGFVGRISVNFFLEELTPNHCYELLQAKKHISTYEILKVLTITGGVPRYLEEFDLKYSAEDNIKRLCFSKSGFLFKEYDLIFHDIFQNRADIYTKIIKSVLNKKLNFSDIAKEIDRQATGYISGYLNDLELSGFLSKDSTYKFDGSISKSAHYRVKDNYIRFYLKCIEPLKNKINKNLDVFKTLEDLSKWHQMLAYQFENLILNNLSYIIKKLQIDPSQIISASPYFQKANKKGQKACQIDLLIQTKFNCLYICEIKFGKKLDLSVIREVEQKILTLKKPRNFSCRPVLIYAGELSEDLEYSDYFYSMIGFKELIKGDVA